MNGEGVMMSTYDGGLSRTATDMATTGAVTADSPAGTNRPAVPESRNTEPTRLKASLR